MYTMDEKDRKKVNVNKKIPVGGEIFRTGRRDHSASLTMDTGSFSAVKQPRRGVNHPPPSNDDVKKRVELYFYSHSGFSWPVTG
jgi:hypothetical protein